MLIYLTNSLIPDKNEELSDELYNAVYNIAFSVVYHNHLLSGDIEVIGFFRTVFHDDRIVGPLFNQLYQNIAFGLVPPEVKFYIEIVYDSPKLRIVDGVKIYQKKYSDFSHPDSVLKTVLVAEFQNDCKFYEHILKWYLYRCKNNLSYSLEYCSGGGLSIFEILEQKLKESHICICIVDTDLRYPGATEQGDTYLGCKDIGKDVPDYKFLPIYVHEIENLIPLNYIDIAFPSWCVGKLDYLRNKKAFDYLKKDGEKILPFFDYKKGIPKSNGVLSNPAYLKFAELCYNQNDDLTSCNADFTSYVASLGNGKQIYPPLIGGSGALKMTIELVQSGHCPDPELLDFQKENWITIGQAMLDWCIARNKEALH